MPRAALAAGPTAFGAADPLDADALDAAPLRSIPRPSRLGEPLAVAPPRAARAAEALGLRTVADLLAHLPARQREARTIATLVPGEAATVVVEVRSIASRPVRRRGMKPLVEATVADQTGPMKVAFFNQPWLERRYGPGTRLVLHGKYEGRNRFRVQSHAPTGEDVAGAGPVAHYPATDGISSTQILALVREHRGAERDFIEALPAALRVRESLPDVAAALAAVHFPEGEGDDEAGRRRLGLEALLLRQLALLRRRDRRRSAAEAPVLDSPPSLTERWLKRELPFELTQDQRLAIERVTAELASPRPMQRLLMGEVGSGKTVVALLAMLRAVEHGRQAALMAPTETLAEQHFATIQRLLGEEMVQVGLLTGSTPARRRADLLGKLASGELRLIVGTHALIEEEVRFDSLAVAVVDEQHRFGVRQRSALDRKGTPHVLHMTATPIPRTLALALYGDLDVTALRELPKGRQPIETHVVTGERERARAYERIREELRAGRQAFVVCPLVEESELLEARAATAEYERLAQGEFRDFRVVLMHGQLRPREKQAAMASFAGGEADVLVATSVIEVGIDVPNATVMLVENAERYGISQLHQLRGRVGRGTEASLCLLFGPADSARLRALEEHDDGFRLAEVDLQIRGEGELIGTRQSGLADLDPELLERAHEHAEAIIAADPELAEPEHALLADALVAVYGTEALEPIAA
jgi:ATP-dependent DNA helicase RecG